MRPASIAFHVDSLNEAFGFPEDYVDPTFGVVADRFFGLADRFGFKATCFVIGRDLEKPAHVESVKRWARDGHEIGSHSQTHLYDFGSLSDERMSAEIDDAHQAITRAVGSPPRGFVAPNWSSSPRHLRAVQERGYDYDASVFPSWLRFPVAASAYLHCVRAGNGRSASVLNQRHLGYALAGSRQPWRLAGGNDLVVLPLPANRFRLGTWHTLAFMFGQELHERILRAAIEDCEAFYYVLHPADLLDPSEVDRSRATNLPRLEVGLAKKLALIESSLRIIAESGRPLVTMSELADSVRRQPGGRSEAPPGPDS